MVLIITAKDIKTFMGAAGDTYEDATWFDAAAQAVSAFIAAECDQNFVKQAYDEFYDGHGKDFMYVAHGPILSVTKVAVDGVQLAVSEYVVYRYYVRLRTQIFEEGLRNVEIAYEGGYDPVPADVKMAGNIVADYLFSRRKTLGTGTTSMAGTTFSIDKDAVPPEALALLDNYREVVGFM